MNDEIVNEMQLMHLIKENQNYNVIVDVITPFHFMAALGFLYYLRDEKNTIPIGIVRIHPHPRTGYVFNITDIINWDFNGVKLAYAINDSAEKDDIISTCLNTLKKRKRNSSQKIYFVAPGTPLFRTIRGMQYTDKTAIRVNIDEGTASFYGKLEWAKDVADSSGSFLAGGRSYALNVMYDVLKYVYGIRLISFSLFDRKHFFGHQMRKYYTKAFEAGMFDCLDDPREEYVIYLSSPYSGDLDIEMKSILKDIFEKISSLGFAVYVKLHPRENEWTGGNYKYINKKMAIESFIGSVKMKPLIVIGWDTTALFTISALWGIDCFSMCDLIKKASHRNMESCKRLMKVASKRIESIHYGEELEGFLEACKKG